MTKLEENKLMLLHKEFETHDKGVDEGKLMMSNGVLVLAYHLKAIKDNKLYKAQGDDGLNTWISYCASKQINPNTALKYITLYEFYIEEMGKSTEVIASISLDTLTRYQPILKKLDPEKREKMFAVLDSPLSLNDKRKEFEDEKLVKPRWLVIIKHDCGKYQIRYNPAELCSCAGQTPVSTINPVDKPKL